MNHREPEVGTDEEKDPDRRQALNHVLEVRVEAVPNVVRPRRREAADAPNRVQEQRQEDDQAGDDLRERVRVLGDRGLPVLRALERTEVVPEVEEGPNAERDDGEKGAQARADEAAVRAGGRGEGGHAADTFRGRPWGL